MRWLWVKFFFPLNGLFFPPYPPLRGYKGLKSSPFENALVVKKYLL